MPRVRWGSSSLPRMCPFPCTLTRLKNRVQQADHSDLLYSIGEIPERFLSPAAPSAPPKSGSKGTTGHLIDPSFSKMASGPRCALGNGAWVTIAGEPSSLFPAQLKAKPEFWFAAQRWFTAVETPVGLPDRLARRKEAVVTSERPY